MIDAGLDPEGRLAAIYGHVDRHHVRVCPPPFDWAQLPDGDPTGNWLRPPPRRFPIVTPLGADVVNIREDHHADAS